MSFGVPVRNGIGIGLKASTSLSTRGGASGPAPGQQAYTTQGTYTWVAPAGVTSVCVVCVGGGAYLSAGGLGWKNDIPVVPGNSYTVRVGNSSPFEFSNAQSSYFISEATVSGGGGVWQSSGGTFVGTGGGNGGTSATFAGGGAGGYTGNGGNGAGGWGANGAPGNGGGGGGGASINSGTFYYSGGGGGVGILGQGASGVGGSAGGGVAGGGGGGSGGANGTNGAFSDNPGNGGLYGGAGGGGIDIDTGSSVYRLGARGAVRIIWGAGRAFPATNTGNV
jgi:hypothetical protein